MKKLIPFSYYGGKSSHLNWLLPIINKIPHLCYVESYGGSAAVILNKVPSKIEVYNDLESEVVNFFRVLRNSKDELMELLLLTPFSREDFTLACTNREGTDIEKAYKFFIRARQVRSGLATTASPGRWSYTKNCSRRGMGLGVSAWLNAIDSLPEICERLRTIQIENLDALDLISRYDDINTLHYIDPPYLPETRSGGVAYASELTKEDHVKLLELLKTLKGKVVLSGYSNNLYSEILSGWKEEKGEIKYAPSSIVVKTLRQESIWTNFSL